MVASMTAFGRAECDLVHWEIRSVNHRYLELGFRLPESFRDLERPLRELTASRIRRGKVDATLRLAAAAAAVPRLDPDAVEHLLAAIRDIGAQAVGGAVGAVDPLDLMRFPGVLVDDHANVEQLKDVAMDRYLAAMDDLVAHRLSEGANLGALLADRLMEVGRIVATVRDLVSGHRDALRDRLRDRVLELTARVDEARLEQEVALLVQKADVAEELDRLDIHAAEARSSLAGDEPCGRRLDFLMQELNREANTLAAKSILPEASRLAVNLKVAIEQMREQIQNVE